MVDSTQFSTSRPSRINQKRGPNSRGRYGPVSPPDRRAPSTRHGTRSAPLAGARSGRSGLPALVLASLPSRWASAMSYLLLTPRNGC